MNFSLTQLEYVMAVQKHGHFAKAAESCNITQPTLSAQIQKLEEDLGVVLFDRTKKPILLTEVGKKLIDQVQSVLFEAKKIESIISSQIHSNTHGELILGIIPTIAPYLLPNLLLTISQKYPDLKLKISELQTDRIIESLNNDEIDVGLLATPLKIPKIFECPIYYEVFSVLCQKNHELSHYKKMKYSHLKSKDIWLLEEGHCLRHQVLDVCSLKKGSTPSNQQFKFESGNLETLKNLVDSFGGYTLLPKMATYHIGDNTKLIDFERPIPAREVGLVYRRQHYKTDLIEALEDAILQSIPEDVRKIRPKDLEVLPIE